MRCETVLICAGPVVACLDVCCFVDFVVGFGSCYRRTIQAMPAQVTAIKLLQLVGVVLK